VGAQDQATLSIDIEQGISKAGYAMTQLARLWLRYQYGSGPVVLKNEAACYG